MRTVPLIDLGDIVSGSTPKTHLAEYWNGDIPWITPADLSGHDGIYFHGKPKRITKAGFDSCSTVMLPPESILFSSRAPIGHSAVTRYPVCTNQGFKNIVPNKRLHSVYAYFALKFLTPSILAKGRGATFAEVNTEIMEQIQIPYCDLAEQQKIAGLLERADRFRRIRRYALQMSDDLGRSMYIQFTDEAFSTNWKRHKFADSEIVEIIDGDRGEAYPKKADFKAQGFCLFLNTSNVLKGEFDFGKCDFITSKKDNELRKGKLERGDIVLTTRGTLGNSALFNARIKFDHVRINSGMVILRVNTDVLLPEYLISIINSGDFEKQILSLTSGSAQQQLPITILNTITLDLPPLTMQKQFVRRAAQHKRLHTTYVEALRQADHLFQSLLHQSFRA